MEWIVGDVLTPVKIEPARCRTVSCVLGVKWYVGGMRCCGVGVDGGKTEAAVRMQNSQLSCKNTAVFFFLCVLFLLLLLIASSNDRDTRRRESEGQAVR